MIEESAEYEKAGFNDAQGQAIRLHELAKRIIECKANRFIANFQYGCWNYQFEANTIDSLWSEVKPRANEEEKELIKSMKNIMLFIMKKNSPFREEKLGLMPDPKNMEIICDWLDRYHSAVVLLQDKYGLLNPSKKEPRGL